MTKNSNILSSTPNTVPPSESQEELKASLESSITSLEGYQNVLKTMPQKAEEWLNDAENKTKEVVKLIHEQFDILRDAIDKKEEEIIQHFEVNETDHETTNELIYNARELILEIPTIVDKVKTLLSEWDNKKEVITDITEEVISVKNKVKSGEEIVKKLKIFENCETYVDTEKFVKGMKRGLNEINGICEIPLKRVLCSAPTGLATKKVYSKHVSLCWDKGEKFGEYIISYREKGGEWSDGDELIRINKKKNQCVVYPLEPDTTYEFRVMGKIDEMEAKWSEAVSAKTGHTPDIYPEVDSAVRELRDNLGNVNECVRVLKNDFSFPRNKDEVKEALGEAGAIETILNTIKTHINNSNICRYGCSLLEDITDFENNQVIAGECDTVEIILNAMKTHVNNSNVCSHGCGTLKNIMENIYNQTKATKYEVFEVILNAMHANINNSDVCENGCGALWNIVFNNENNQTKAREYEVIDTILNAMNTHIENESVCNNGCGTLRNISIKDDVITECEVIDVVLRIMKKHNGNPDLCENGCGVLGNITEGNSSIQKLVCKKDGLTILVKILKDYINYDDISLLETCHGTIGVLLSSKEVYSKFYTRAVLSAVKKCYEKHKDSKQIKQVFFALTREEDAKVKDAVSKGICTKDSFPKCEDDCGCDEGIYCHKCCVQQKAFRCRTCDKDENSLKFYCETCWKKHHRGHECEEFFCPVRCATK